jgi:hypothetical protein
MKFKIGQKVAANQTSHNAHGVGVKKGEIFTIKDIFICPSCKNEYYNVGLPRTSGVFVCGVCGANESGLTNAVVHESVLDSIVTKREEKIEYKTRIVDVEIDRRLHVEAKKYLALCN